MNGNANYNRVFIRDVGRSEMWWAKYAPPPVVEIGLTGLPKSGRCTMGPLPTTLPTALFMMPLCIASVRLLIFCFDLITLLARILWTGLSIPSTRHYNL